jgi:polar amino acid transport system permease protein
MLKTTSLVVAVPFALELTYATSGIGNRLFLPIPLLVIAALWYLLITSILMVGQHYLEQYYGRGFGTATGRRGKAKGPGGRQAAIAAAGTVKEDVNREVTP